MFVLFVGLLFCVLVCSLWCFCLCGCGVWVCIVRFVVFGVLGFGFAYFGFLIDLGFGFV